MAMDEKEKRGELGEVLQQVSGQLRSSLNNIYRSLERIAPPELRDQEEGLDMDAAILCQSYYRILRLANNLSDAALLDQPIRAKLRNDDIVGFCRDMLRQARLPAELLGLTLEFRCAKSSHIIAMDRERLKRLLLNLLSNAFKFTPKGGRILLEVRVEAQQVALLLSDTGCGIAPELLETVFDRYLHTDRVDPPPHGLGLGLPICRRIVQEHGGSLLLTSQPGEGTTVTVSLPNRKTAVQELSSFIIDYSGGFNPILLELCDAAAERGFRVIAAGAFIARHSIVPDIAAGRPDSADFAALERFAAAVREKLAAAPAAEALSAVTPPGSRPYREFGGVPMHPSAPKSKCGQCGKCAAECPTGAIDPAAPEKTDGGKCITCMRCVAVCPHYARRLNPAMLAATSVKLKKACAVRREPEFFL